MKKRFRSVVLMIAVFGMVAAACAKSSNPGSGSTATVTTSGGTPTPTVSTLVAGKLKVGSCLDYKPFEYYQGTTLKGFDIDITEAIATKLGLQVEWVKANFDTIFTALRGKQFDMVAAASTITPERQQVVNFSDPYYASEQALTINTAKTPTIASGADLASGDTLGVQKGTTGKDYATTTFGPKGVQIRTFDLAPDAFTALEAGSVTGVVNDAPSSAAEIETRPDLKIVEQYDTGENYGLAIAKSDPSLLAAVNEALKELIADGTYATIFTKYFPGVAVPTQYQPAA